MSAVTLKCQVRFGKEPERAPRAKRRGDFRRVSPLARRLALAYHIEGLVECGEIDSYAEAARILSVTRTRVTQIMSLLSLSAEIQEALLSGTLELSERRARELERDPTWQSQRP